MVTRDELQGILARHVMASESDCVDQAQEDRGALLDLIKRLAARGWETQDTYEDPICFFCGALISFTWPSWEEMEAGAKSVKVCNHTADCPAPLLEVLR